MIRACAIFILLFASCGPAEGETHLTQQQEIRPTEPDAALGLGYGAAGSDSFVSASGDFRVWWATTGEHVPPAEDSAPADGVPDFVNQVADAADDVQAYLRANNWRVAVGDGNQGGIPNGGDEKFDIYLVNFGGSADGSVVRNACFQNGEETQCTGHMLIENDFFGYGYPSISEAITILVSHEYFHAVQAAYTDDVPAWWSEGTATWFEEAFYPDQSDFERLASGYFEEVDRSLNSPVQGPFDSFSYHTSIFPYFIDLVYGADVLRVTFENIAAGEDVIPAIDSALGDADSSIGEAFALFSFWNIFTGDRATDGGYPQSGQFAKVPITPIDASGGANWDVEVESMTAKWGLLTLGGDKRVSLESIDGFSQTVTVYAGTSPDNVVLIDEEGTFFDDDQIYVAAGNGFESGDAAARIKVRTDDGSANNANNANNSNNTNGNTNNVDVEPDDDGCSTTTASSSWFVFVVLFFIGIRTRRQADFPNE